VRVQELASGGTKSLMAKIYRSLTVVFALWLLVWLRLSWPAMQDDAFIHLRYAVNLLQHHMISYDGVHPDYGTSSLLYVWLLAGLREFFTSPVLPRAVSSVCHVLLFGGLAWGFARVLRGAPRLAWGFAMLLLAVLVTPMAVRWLDDGMETSLSLCLAALIAFAVSRLGHSERVSSKSAAWMFVLGFVATLARVEYLLLLSVASLTLFCTRLSLLVERAGGVSLSARVRLAMRCAAPLVGSLLAAALIFFTMHGLVPDTAIAKAFGLGEWQSTLSMTLSAIVASLSFGMVLVGLWVLTAAAAISYTRRVTLPIMAVNSLFPITVGLAALRGQQVQGIRYFAWTLLFPIVWNMLELRWSARKPAPSIDRTLRFASYGLAAVLVALLPIESVLLNREFRARKEALAEFRAQHLEQLRSMKLVAFDVGYIGYFTQSPVCDMAGLVNGRARAALSLEDRVVLCAAERPPYAFVSGFSMGVLNNRLDLKDWSICSVYDMANLRASDVHYLIASPAATAEVCAAAGNAPEPLAPVLHPAAGQ
jgi:hypothetical protein